MTPKLVLASSSPFRRMLMENAGLAFEAHAAHIDERAIEAPLEKSGATPDQVALVLAEAKADEVSRRRMILAAEDAVKRWVYKPTLVDKMPIEVLTIVSINFKVGE